MIEKFSQNDEQFIIERLFGQYVGTLLSIGENQGTHLSNVYALILNGWSGDLVEPSPQVYPDLCNLHQYNNKVFCHQFAIGDRDEQVVFYDSGELLKSGDRALVSSADLNETKRWSPLNISFREEAVQMLKWDTFLSEHAYYKKYNLISIDAEGFDIIIMRQMEFDQLGCTCLVIEHNSIPANVAIIREYCRAFGFKEIGFNAENIIMAII